MLQSVRKIYLAIKGRPQVGFGHDFTSFILNSVSLLLAWFKQLLRCGAVVGILAGLIFGTVFHSSADYHEAIHEHSDSASHECLLTVLSDGGVEVATTHSEIAPLVPIFKPVDFAYLGVQFKESAYRFPPERGPPSKSS